MKTAIVTAPPGAARNVHQTMNKILLTVAAAAALGVATGIFAHQDGALFFSEAMTNQIVVVQH